MPQSKSILLRTKVLFCVITNALSRHRMTEEEEDEELLNESSTEEGPMVARFADSPSCQSR